MKSLLITGTDTEVGKTVLTTALTAYWQKYRTNSSLGIMKPIQSGMGDCETYQKLFSLQQSAEEITPLYFLSPLAPPIAAMKENRHVDLAVVWQALTKLQSQRDFVLIEALGGLGSPVTDELTVADIAAEWRLPTILVVPIRLGAISQAVANVALAKFTHVNLLGIVLNCTQALTEEEIDNWAPSGLMRSLTNTPILGCIPYLDDLTDLDKLAQVASNLDLERISF